MTANSTDVIILGAGFSGLCAAIELERSGRNSYVVLEKGDEIGGTWRDNTYPGVECDVPSHLYSFSFAPNPHWSKHFGTGREIWEYMRECVVRFGLSPKIVLGTRAVRAEWGGAGWTVTTDEGAVYRSRFLIAGLGGLHTPNVPDFPNREGFSGLAFHTSQWPQHLGLTGKRVGMIGTGATAVQAAPEVADVAAEFHLFQRSPVWVGPKKDPHYSAMEREAFEADPDLLRRHRWELWRTWESTGVNLFKAGTAANRTAQEQALRNITNHVEDSNLATKLTPSYNITCKRPTISNKYYPMFNRRNVNLVTDSVERFSSAGLVLAGGREIPLDVVVMATGFKPFDITTEIDIIGVDGLSLAEAWEDRIQTYRSIMVHGFPNLFILLGPNSAGLTSSLQMIEAGVQFVLDRIVQMDSSASVGIHPTPEAVDDFTSKVDSLTRASTANHGCVSWWTRGGTNHALWPDSSISYRMMLSDFDPRLFVQVKGRY